MITFVADDPETGGENNGDNSVGNDNNNSELDWTLIGTDADDFEINGTTGVLTFKDGPDYEAPTDSGSNNGYDVTVQVTDDGGNTVSQRVRVTVTNVGEAGTIKLSHTQPEVGARLTATLSDPDNPRSIGWQWYRGTLTLNEDGSVANSGGRCSAANIPCSIDSATTATYRPVADDDGQVLTVVASYTDGHRSGKTAILTTTNSVQAEDEDNVDPQFLNDANERITGTRGRCGRMQMTKR